MDQIEALTCVLEGVCPKCQGDVQLVEVGGTRTFLDDHYSTTERVVLEGPNPIHQCMLDILDCEEKDLLGHIDKLRELHMTPVTKSSKRPRVKKVVTWDVPRGVSIHVWEHHEEDSLSYEIGVQTYQCPACNVDYEAYALAGGDWTLAGWEEE